MLNKSGWHKGRQMGAALIGIIGLATGLGASTWTVNKVSQAAITAKFLNQPAIEQPANLEQTAICKQGPESERKKSGAKFGHVFLLMVAN